MTMYMYDAYTNDGAVISGQVEASDRIGALEALNKQNIKPLFIREAKETSVSINLFTKNKVKSEDLVVFTRELSAMASAGVPLLRALTSLESHTESQALKRMLRSIIIDVEAGMPLADAFEKFPDTFSRVYVNMIRAGEAAGILDDILKRLALQQEKNATMRKKIKSAMTYPMVLIGITVLAFFGLMLFVIPQIGKIIQDLGGPDAELPLLTQVMLNLSSGMVNYWYIVLPILVGVVVFVLRYIRTPKGKYQFDGLILKIPGVKSIATKVAVARFARTFSALIGTGVAVLEALDVTAKAIGNSRYEEVLIGSLDSVKAGIPLSSVIEKSSLFPPIVSQMLSVGEETGQTDTVLVKVADFYEEEVDVAIDGLSSIIEPVMIVFMGGIVGLVAASVMLPIANLSNSIQG